MNQNYTISHYYLGFNKKEYKSLWKTFLIKGAIVIFCTCVWIVSAKAQSLSFSFESTTSTFCAPATIRFIPNFSPTPITFYWQFGIENEESEVFSPVFTYTSPGNYRVTLVALFDNQILEVTRVVSIHGPANFSIGAIRTAFCKPDQVDFTVSSSSSLSSLEWSFGDGSPPVPGNGNTMSHNYAGFGNFAATLTAIDARGCTGSAGLPISIRRPTAALSDSPRLGCLPVSVRFTADVALLPGDEVAEYRWNFGDGSPIITNQNSVMQRTYTLPNTYLPELSIVTKDGCSNNFEFAPLAFGTQPNIPKLIGSADTICASEIPEFTITNSNGASSYLWQLSNGDEITTNVPSLSYKFSDFGNFKVKVRPIYNGCIGLADSVNIFVQGVIANFNFSNSCANRALFDFRSTSRGIVNSFFWDFGDGTTSAVSRPTKLYAPSGSFPLLFKVRQNATGCEDSVISTIYTARPSLVDSDTFICRGSGVKLEILENYSNPRVSMNWLVVGRATNNSSENSITTTATTPGVFTNRVIINNGAGYCRDTLTQQMQVRIAGPISSFSIPANTCISDALPINNSSTSANSVDTLIRWEWDFGNGVKSDKRFPDPVEYFAVGNYRLQLAVEDNKGCRDSTSQLARIRRLPILRVFPLNQKVCQGQEVQLTALHRSNLQWTPANLVNCDTCTHVIVKPEEPTTYNVTASDDYGCVRTQNISLDVWYPFDLEPNVLRDTAVCVGASVPFDLKTSGQFITWTPAAGLSGANIPNPIATPLSTTTYLATVTDSGQCFTRTASATIRVNPFPQVDMGPDLILPYDAAFTLTPIYGPDITGYRWLPANRLSCSTCPTPSGRVEVSTSFSLIATTSQGCSQTFRLNLTVDCSEKNLLMPSGFTPNGDGLNDVFYPHVRGMRVINRFMIYNRFGQLVYERRNFPPNDKSYGWDGRLGGKPQPVGSYVYYVEAECDLGQTLSAKGTISILR